MLITRLIYIQWKSSGFLLLVSTVSARNAWEHGLLFGARHTETPTFLESPSAKASSTYETEEWWVNDNRRFSYVNAFSHLCDLQNQNHLETDFRFRSIRIGNRMSCRYLAIIPRVTFQNCLVRAKTFTVKHDLYLWQLNEQLGPFICVTFFYVNVYMIHSLLCKASKIE